MEKSPREGSRVRRLRWPKFLVLLFFASVCAAKALPVLRVLRALVDRPLVFHPEPLLLPALAVLAAGILLVGIVVDVVLDRLLPRSFVAALVLLAALPWSARERSADEERAQLRQAARAAAEAIGKELARGEVPTAAALPPSGFRTRSLQVQAFTLSLLPQGEVFPGKAEVRPATIYVAIDGEGGWLTIGESSDRGPRLLRGEGGIEVFRIGQGPGREEGYGI